MAPVFEYGPEGRKKLEPLESLDMYNPDGVHVGKIVVNEQATGFDFSDTNNVVIHYNPAKGKMETLVIGNMRFRAIN